MAKKDRQKRSARKARQRERAELEAARATSGQVAQSDAKSSRGIKKSEAQSPKKDKSKGKDGKAKKKGPVARMRGYFAAVKVELHQVVWPSRTELRNYSVAVVAMLIVFGVCVWLVDTGFVQGLVALTGLRG